MSRIIASRGRLGVALGVIVAGATLAVPLMAGTATASSTAHRTTVSQRPADRHRATSADTSPAALTGLACRTLTHCVAIGANSPQMATQLIGERWNGSTWVRGTAPKPSGTVDVSPGGIACPADHTCVAVGAGYPKTGPAYIAIAEYWNGSRWTTARAATPGASSLLSAVSCPSAKNCYAVGQYTPKGKTAWAPLIEHWDGTAWFKQTAPVPAGSSFGSLSDVSCPTSKFCVAAGTDGAGELIERWNGADWSFAVPKSSKSAMLYGVSCPSPSSCFAVGTDATASGGSLVERWNGRSWAGSTTPVPSGASYPWLQSISCVSATHCLAVGGDLDPGVYAALWNGHGWHLTSTAATGGHLGNFEQVRCLTATSCVALAETTQVAATQRSESAFWNGTRWTVRLTA